MERDHRFQNILGKIKIDGRVYECLIDTGSNCSLIQANLLDKKTRSTEKVEVDFPTVDDAVGRVVSLKVDEFCGREETRERGEYKFIMYKDLQKVIPGYPKEAPLLIGTNLLDGFTLCVDKDSPYVTLYNEFDIKNIEDSLEDIYEVPTYQTRCEIIDRSHGPFVIAKTNLGGFLADTGNLQSTFCIKCAPGNVKIELIPYKKKFERKTIFVEGLRKIKKSESLSTVEGNCGVEVNGNLSKDVWVGVFQRTYFDFNQKRVKIFCVYKN